MPGVDEMLAELEASVAEIEREVSLEPRHRGWLVAHRERIASLRVALASAERPTPVAVDAIEAVTDMKAALRAYKRSLVERALATSGGDNLEAARMLGIHPKYLYQLLRELELTPPSSGPASSRRRKTLTPVPASARKA